MIKAVIFDIDGVVLDSNKIVIKTHQETAKKFGLPVPSADAVRKRLGYVLTENLKFFCGRNDKEIIKTYRDVIKKLENKIKPMPHIIEIMQKLKKPKAIVTSKSRPIAERQLGNLLSNFQIVITAEDTNKHKPNPEPLSLACERLKVKPSETIYIGDSVVDYQTAKNAGVDFIGFVHDGSTREEFRKVRATKLITSLNELLKVIK